MRYGFGRLSKRCLMVLMGALVTAFALYGCGAPSQDRDEQKQEQVDIIDDGTSDQMFNESVNNAELYVMCIDGKTTTADGYRYDVDVTYDEPLADGFYKVVADVTYLNGGIAGYVDYPQIDRVVSCTEVSPLEIGLPSLGEQSRGLMLIGDYADGDVLLVGYDTMAVWKDGSWTYRYDEQLELADGTLACVREGVSEADVETGVANGVVMCEDYVVLPKE